MVAPNSSVQSTEWHGRFLAGFVVALIAVFVALGGLRIISLLLFSFDFQIRPIEFVALPIGGVAILLCRQPVPQSRHRVRRLAIIAAWIAISVPLMFGVLFLITIKFLSKGFP
ncbi:hypothetical protein N8553_03595 [bacterium]|nr:hypothetical protein [bacterium]